MKEALWYIGSILVLSVVSLLASFERIDYEVERNFGFYRDQCLPLFKIFESEIHIRNEYFFWNDISTMLYEESKTIPFKDPLAKTTFDEYVLFCLKRTNDFGDAILGEEDQK